ncbi:MAG: cysteine hydrolase [Actinobacteria bacterium]|nr:MAG: cysteine hydrolase [Actinomycetota bacterium]
MLDVAAAVGDDTDAAAVFCIDMIRAFTTEGALSCSRNKALAEPIAELLTDAYAAGVRNFVLPQDCHSHDAEEFKVYPPHAVAGSSESATVPELASLPFASTFTVMAKNSLNPAIGTDLEPWLEAHPQVRTAIVVGDCTDLCLYQLAMYLRLRANQYDMRGYRVLVVASCVNTYSTGVHHAQQLHVDPHPGDFYHYVFLNHLHCNGVEVYAAAC